MNKKVRKKRRFCTVINCMDGRAQQPVIRYLQKRFNALYVDIITEPGPNLILSQRKNKTAVQSILHRVKIFLERHKSVSLAVAGHAYCAGNPAPCETQKKQIQQSVRFLSQLYNDIEIIGLWVDRTWQVREI